MKGFSFILVLFCCVLLTPSSAQICTGNLGENIFTEGDFGSGSANVIQSDPGIAPGYTYTTAVPPSDGFYTITNNISNWPSRFDWLGPSDNSSDANGYMMVINASVEPGKFYEQQVTGLCENTLYEFSADVFNVIPTGKNYIKPRVAFEIDGIEQFDTGDIPENQQWNTYGFTFETAADQTEVTLALVNKAPGGIGNDLALDNITFRACGPLAQILPESIADVCEDGDPQDIFATITGDQYPTPFIQWQRSLDSGTTWEDILGETELTYTHTQLESGDYYYRYILANEPSNLENSKCRVNSNVKVVRVIPKFSETRDTICDGLTSYIGNRPYTTSGTYVDTLANRLGCDSVITLFLEVVEDRGIDIEFDLTDPSCTGDTDGRITIAQISDGNAPFNITIDEQNVTGNGMLNNLPAGSYLYEIEDTYGCVGSQEAILIDPDPFLIDLGPDQQIDLGDEIILSLSGNQSIVSIITEPALDINCDMTCNDVEILPLDSGTFIATATDETGCTATDAINITVNKVRKVFFPNAFSPNNDGTNDVFTIFADIPNVQIVESLVIYDRWGNLVFQRDNFLPNDLLEGWNGSGVNNQILKTGTYVYASRIKFLDEEVIEYSGSLSLVQ